jgi:hypothetical protein
LISLEADYALNEPQAWSWAAGFEVRPLEKLAVRLGLRQMGDQFAAESGTLQYSSGLGFQDRDWRADYGRPERPIGGSSS